MSEDRVVLVTGASNGLGAALAGHFARRGFGVVMNYIVEEHVAVPYRQLAGEVGESKLMKFRADVADRKEVRSMFDAAIDKFGRVGVLINSAGINRDAPFVEMTDEQWDTVVSAHLRGHFVCCQEYVFHNPAREGVIINLGANCGQEGRNNGANFCSAKGGIFAFTKCLALELAPGIRVNCLVPGAVKTREVIERHQLETEEGLARQLATVPMRRLGELEDVLQMVDCMIEAKFTTGENFYVNGGQYMQ